MYYSHLSFDGLNMLIENRKIFPGYSTERVQIMKSSALVRLKQSRKEKTGTGRHT